MIVNAPIALSPFLASYPLKRYGSGTYSNGILTNSSTTSSIDLAVMPLTGEDMVRIPEANRTRARYKVYSLSPLYTSKESGATQADEITYNGYQYQVESIEPWGDYYRAIIVKLGGN